MALPALTRQLIETKLKKYCEKRVPEEARSEIRLSFKIRGNSVTLTEERPLFYGSIRMGGDTNRKVSFRSYDIKMDAILRRS